MKHYKAIADFYDPENTHRAMLSKDVPFLLSKMPRRRQAVLELACGTGRAAIPLAQAGHRVVGLDYDAKMLQIARRKRDFVGLADRNLSLVKANVVKFDLRKKFDWVVLLFNTFLGFTELDEQDAILENVARHLKPSGWFWLDIFQPDLGRLAERVTEELDPFIFHVPESDLTVFRTATVRRDPARQLQHVTFHYQWFDAKGIKRKAETAFEMTFIFPRELQLLFERNGLAIEKIWGNYDGSKLNADSPRMIVLGRRA